MHAESTSTPSTETTSHEVHEFVARAQQELQNEYARIHNRASEDPGTAGDQGEENWATLFRQWLPSYFHIITKGRILTESGYASRQIDLLVLYPSYPKILLDKKLYLSAGVAAAFECKMTVTSAHVKKAVQTSAELKRNLPKREGTPYRELHAGIIYGLLAHSHSWKGERAKPVENIHKALTKADQRHVAHPRECIDFVTVSDLACWQVTKIAFVSPCLPFYNEQIREVYGKDGSAASAFSCHAIEDERQSHVFSPIGSLLAGLFTELAWEFADMRTFSDYFRKVNLLGSGRGEMRLWGIDIYSKTIRDRVYRGQMSNGPGFDEWRVFF